MNKPFIFLLFFSFICNAQIFITHENDFLAIDNKDENYTGGLNIELLFEKFNFKQPFYELKDSYNMQTISLGGVGYTPQDLTSVIPVIGDRPYSSLVYLVFGKNSIKLDNSESISSKFLIGNMGGSGPGRVQYFLHDVNFLGSARPNPLGWHNQIGYDGSLVLNYNVRYLKRLNKKLTPQSSFFKNTSYTVGVDLGNYMINLQGGFFVDIVNLNSYPTLGYRNIMIPTKSNFKSNYIEKKNFRGSFFINPFVRIVGYNSTLEGLMFNDKSVYTIPHSEVNRVLFEFNTGIRLLLWERFHLKYTFTARTQEFTGGKKMHYWGGVTIGYTPKKWIH
ncbi:lipid A-modifier LpxR family protein [Tenacibaculum caenipelagi]|uniref:Lipid A deacylase LpxR family protein n=1 Tax=Tenacibaculum caenipelagi TaxID=1325435 RepID=A0A4R6THE4_9FLAO|nr:lipid A-modifier LpxR family protein [Tenacibaculum caenipelagi]TDQ28586.1 hypothetical protein DFQ07_0962 [Tenacibaculum caenipelagi]